MGQLQRDVIMLEEQLGYYADELQLDFDDWGSYSDDQMVTYIGALLDMQADELLS